MVTVLSYTLLLELIGLFADTTLLFKNHLPFHYALLMAGAVTLTVYYLRTYVFKNLSTSG